MTGPQRELRRCALLIFPGESLNPEALDRIAAEGFTDVGIGVFGNPDRRAFTGQGHSVDQAREMAGLAHERDLGVIFFTGYMKYQEEIIQREPGRAMVVRGSGDGADSDGLPTLWLCPFRPENRKDYLEIIREIVSWPGAREIHLNDEASLASGDRAMGCYCDFCCAEFRSRSGSSPPTEPDPHNDLWWEWVDFRMASWTAVHAEFRQAVKAVRPDILVGIQHNPLHACFSRNPVLTAVSLARDAKAMDVLATDPYHFIHCAHIPYRPHRRILAEATRSLAGACLRRHVNMYPQAFMPPGQSTPLDRGDGLLAGIVPFALGADTITPYAYELMKIVPGLFEGLQDARRLEPHLSKARPYAFATVIRPLHSEIRGHPGGDWGKQYLVQAAEVMYRCGLPWRWLWDERLDDAGEDLAGPLVVPDAHCLTDVQVRAIRRVAERGEGVLWIGNTPPEPWSGKGACPLPSSFQYGTFQLETKDGHALTSGLVQPLMLLSRAGRPGLEGETVGTVEGGPGLVLCRDDERREAWLTGLPLHTFIRKGAHGANRTPTGGVDLLRRLLLWAAGREPLVWLDPWPPPNDYNRLRPWDRRDVPTAELLPLLDDGGLLAVIFPYTPVAFQTSLIVNPPPGRSVRSALELWQGEDLTSGVRREAEDKYRLELSVPGDTELLAVRIEWA